jgi:hypothetical protein
VAQANLRGVWAKWDRAIEQLKALDEEIRAFGREANPYTVRVETNVERTHYVFYIYPEWEKARVFRWGAIVGEIVHDFRSALDQLVWQLVLLNGAEGRKSHSFPICGNEPSQGFGVHMRREWTDSRGKVRYGPLFGVSKDALTIIERYQPYKGGDGLLLARLHAFWNIDKHNHLIPMYLIGEPARIDLKGGRLIDRLPDRFEDGAYVVEVVIEPGSDPHVDVEPSAPRDIAFDEGIPVVTELKRIGEVILPGVLIPLAELFPDLQGIGP